MRRRVVVALVLALGACGNGQDTQEADAGALPDAHSPTCDVLGADACTTDPSRTKCNVTIQQGALTTRCLALTGTRPLGDTCTRGAMPGADDCDKTLFCSGLGVEVRAGSDPPDPVARYCRAFCLDDTRCQEGERCVTLVREPRVGLCVPAGCLLLADTCPGGTACDAFVHADGENFVGICRAVGPVPLGGDCSASDCVAGARCYATSPTNVTCQALCDESHPCANGGLCTIFAGMTGGAGICL
jgi:hypothetical protein